jgi:hypothetical protein
MIVQRNRDFLQNGGTFVVPMPEVKVINGFREADFSPQ